MQDSRNRDYYKILEVSRTATQQDIKEAFRRLAREYHPDLHPGNPLAEEKFKEICEAYEVLSNQVQRTQYDQEVGVDSHHSEPKKQGMNAHDFYARAAAKALERDYQGALKDYTQAIEVNPRFAEAYIKRGAIRYKLGDARGTLKDCTQALQIDSESAPAYYHQGRARYRLGYTQAAIEAYTQAIAKDANHAQAYYHRGLAHNDLKDIALAVEDLQNAAQLFNEQGDRTGYCLAKDTLRNLNKTHGNLKNAFPKKHTTAVSTLLGNTLKSLQCFMFNPVGGLFPAFTRLRPRQAIAVGFTFAIIANLCFVGGVYAGWQDFLNKVSLFKLLSVGVVPFVSLGIISAIARGIFRKGGSGAGDIFLAGATLLPIGFVIFLSSVAKFLPAYTMLVLSVFASCYTILMLYSGCTQISNLSEKVAAFVVPVMLLLSGWLSYCVFTALLL